MGDTNKVGASIVMLVVGAAAGVLIQSAVGWTIMGIALLARVQMWIWPRPWGPRRVLFRSGGEWPYLCEDENYTEEHERDEPRGKGYLSYKGRRLIITRRNTTNRYEAIIVGGYLG